MTQLAETTKTVGGLTLKRLEFIHLATGSVDRLRHVLSFKSFPTVNGFDGRIEIETRDFDQIPCLTPNSNWTVRATFSNQGSTKRHVDTYENYTVTFNRTSGTYKSFVTAVIILQPTSYLLNIAEKLKGEV